MVDAWLLEATAVLDGVERERDDARPGESHEEVRQGSTCERRQGALDAPPARRRDAEGHVLGPDERTHGPARPRGDSHAQRRAPAAHRVDRGERDRDRPRRHSGRRRRSERRDDGSQRTEARARCSYDPRAAGTTCVEVERDLAGALERSEASPPAELAEIQPLRPGFACGEGADATLGARPSAHAARATVARVPDLHAEQAAIGHELERFTRLHAHAHPVALERRHAQRGRWWRRRRPPLGARRQRDEAERGREPERGDESERATVHRTLARVGSIAATTSSRSSGAKHSRGRTMRWLRSFSRAKDMSPSRCGAWCRSTTQRPVSGASSW
jgi:hypothetical protein